MLLSLLHEAYPTAENNKTIGEISVEMYVNIVTDSISSGDFHTSENEGLSLINLGVMVFNAKWNERMIRSSLLSFQLLSKSAKLMHLDRQTVSVAVMATILSQSEGVRPCYE